MELKIREYTADDLPCLADSFRALQEQTVSIDTIDYYRSFQDFDALAYAASFLQELTAMGGKVFVAEKDGQLIGHSIVTVENVTKKEALEFYCTKRGHIHELYIDAAFRHAGIGTKLMERAEEYCRTLGCEWVTLGVLRQNAGAKEFYRKRGYTEHAIECLKKL